MSKVTSNRFHAGGYVDVPFAREMERLGDNLASSLSEILDCLATVEQLERAKKAIEEWRNMEKLQK